MTYVLIGIMAALIIMGVVLYFSISALESEKEKTKRLEEKVNEQTTNIAFLVKHAEEMQNIKKQTNDVMKEIEHAKTDEEIANIVGVIISTNNQRVQNNATN